MRRYLFLAFLIQQCVFVYCLCFNIGLSQIPGNFEFSAHHLGGFIREHVVPLLDDSNATVRREAVFTLAKVIAKLAGVDTFKRLVRRHMLLHITHI